MNKQEKIEQEVVIKEGDGCGNTFDTKTMTLKQTHTACKSRLKKEGVKAKCCFCERHFPCDLFPILQATL